MNFWLCYICIGQSSTIRDAVTMVNGTAMCRTHAQEEWLARPYTEIEKKQTEEINRIMKGREKT